MGHHSVAAFGEIKVPYYKFYPENKTVKTGHYLITGHLKAGYLNILMS
jgi:hypothetical protein